MYTSTYHPHCTQISKGVRDRLAPLRAIGPLATLARHLTAFGRGLHELLGQVEAGKRMEIIQLVCVGRDLGQNGEKGVGLGGERTWD